MSEEEKPIRDKEYFRNKMREWRKGSYFVITIDGRTYAFKKKKDLKIRKIHKKYFEENNVYKVLT